MQTATLGMRTSASRYLSALISLLIIIVYANVGIGVEVVLDANAVTKMSEGGVAIVGDRDASIGKAIEFQDGANNPLAPNPTSYFEMEFFVIASGRYYIWIRGKTEGGEEADSLWIQFDDEIGTNKGDRFPGSGLGNWRDVSPPDAYVWASNEVPPPTVESIVFNKAGKHKLRAQPRQVPHRIDQIWLNSVQDKRPADSRARSLDVHPARKLTTIWGQVKRN